MWAYVRKHGSIGIFYARFFRDVYTKDDWFKYYGRYWELHHFVIPKFEAINMTLPADTPKQLELRSDDIW